MIDLRHLKHLMAVAEHGNFSRAAEALHLTQPALSRSIQALEASVGAAVLERTRGAIAPTDIGQLLLRHAQALDISARDLDREIALTKGLELGELRIGVGPFAGSALVGPVVGQLNRLHPRLHLKLVVAPWQELPERARAREVDLIVLELSQVEKLEDFAAQALSEHRGVLVCRPGHPLTRHRSARAEHVFGYPLAGPALAAHAAAAVFRSMPGELRKTLQRTGLLTIECDSSMVLKSVLIESDALSMMPRFVIDAELRSGQLVVIEGIDFGVHNRFGAAWLRQRSVSAAGAKFIELLRARDAAFVEPPARRAGRAGRPKRAAAPDQPDAKRARST